LKNGDISDKESKYTFIYLCVRDWDVDKSIFSLTNICDDFCKSRFWILF